jgi:hypothetical protein
MPIRLKASRRRSALGICGLIAATLAAQGGPLRRADVAAEPTFVLHLDVDALRPTAIGQFLLGEMDKPAAQGMVATFQTIFNLDPRKQLHGLTLYSTGKAPEDGVLLVYGEFEVERLVTVAKGARDYQSASYRQHPIHSWINEQKIGSNGVTPRVYAAFPSERMVICAQKEARVAEALDVLDHKAPSLADGTLFPQLGAKGTTSFMQAAARKLNIPDFAPDAAVLRMAKAAWLEIGEAQGQLRVSLNLEAGDEEASKQMVSVGQGLVALMKLQQDNQGSVKLAEGLSLKQDGTGVAATLVVPTAQAIELMKSGAAGQVLKKAKAG